MFLRFVWCCICLNVCPCLSFCLSFWPFGVSFSRVLKQILGSFSILMRGAADGRSGQVSDVFFWFECGLAVLSVFVFIAKSLGTVYGFFGRRQSWWSFRLCFCVGSQARKSVVPPSERQRKDTKSV